MLYILFTITLLHYLTFVNINCPNRHILYHKILIIVNRAHNDNQKKAEALQKKLIKSDFQKE